MYERPDFPARQDRLLGIGDSVLEVMDSMVQWYEHSSLRPRRTIPLSFSPRRACLPGAAVRDERLCRNGGQGLPPTPQDEEPLEQREVVRRGLGDDPISNAEPAVDLGELEVVELIRGDVDAGQAAEADGY